MAEYINRDDVFHLLNSFPITTAIHGIENLKPVHINEDSRPVIYLPSGEVPVPHIPNGGDEYKKGYERGWRDCIAETRRKNNVISDIYL